MMLLRRPTSVVILITLAELAWLAAFGLLFAYRSKDGELGRIGRQLNVATNRLAQWEANAPEATKLFKQLDLAKSESQRLREGLQACEKLLRGRPLEEAARLLAEAEGAEQRLAKLEEESRELKLANREKQETMARILVDWRSATNELVQLRRTFAAFPPNAAELATLFQTSTNRIALLEKELLLAQGTNSRLSATLRSREVGEFSVRRELTGLPSRELRRVIFLVDTSSSMRNSPAWESARA